MIQDDFGTLVHTPGTASITERLDDGDARRAVGEHRTHPHDEGADPGDLSTLDDPSALEVVKRALQRGPEVGS